MRSKQSQVNKVGNILALATITLVGVLVLAYVVYPLLGKTAVLVVVLIAPLLYIMAMEGMAPWMKFKVDRMVYRVAFWWCVIAIIPILGYLFYPMLGWVAILPAILVGVAVLYFSGRRMRSYLRTKAFQDDADNVIRQALQIMDSTSSYYSDEEEANKELATTLKALSPNANIEYEPNVHGESIGDIKIGGTVIEGKLDLLDKHEADRLVGQIQWCCSHSPFKVKVVIYGRISPQISNRIMTLSQYPERVSLIALGNPRRVRKTQSEVWP